MKKGLALLGLIILAAVVILAATGLVLFKSKNTPVNNETLPVVNDSSKKMSTSPQPSAILISPEEAVEKVKSRKEVIAYLKRVPNAIIQAQLTTDEEDSYRIQVYEIKNGHTATFNWYNVDKKTGEITAEFDFEEGTE